MGTKRPMPFRHAPGFGDYVRATMERPHPVTSAYVEDGSWRCGRCTFPVVALKEKA